MFLPLKEPATWFSEPGDEGVSFAALECALAYAVAVPAETRNPHACIVTQSGSIYGWDAIKYMADRHEKLFDTSWRVPKRRRGSAPSKRSQQGHKRATSEGE